MNIKLHNNVLMQQFGLGTFLVESGEVAYETVKYALEIGYRHIDTAQMYRNEESVGKAIYDSKIPRDQIFITTKQRGHSTKENMLKAFNESLQKLKTDYIDLYLIHWPNQDKLINQQTWSFFEELYLSKKVRSIGVSNFTRSHLEDLFETAKIKPMVNQVELHPGLTQVNLNKFLKSHDIQIESYGPFMKGLVFEEPFFLVLDKIAKKYQKTVPQIVISWGLHKGFIMIPKSVTKERILENFLAQEIKLTDEEILEIDQLNRAKRLYSDPDNSPWGPYFE
jgi:methylglyoxal/glyoxal reductase